MNILILEDEKAAASRLQKLVKEILPHAIVQDVLESVRESISWFKNNVHPDIILSDIQLADGLSIDLFRQIETTAPVIFITAYDAYTLNAFKLNSIDYLLKPIDKEELKAAFTKYSNLHRPTENISKQVLDLFQNIANGKTHYKSRFLIKQGDGLTTILINEVAYIRADDKVVFLHTLKGQKYIIDDPLDELEKVMDPVLFFRLNRTYIAPLTSIDKINNHFNGRLKINLLNCDDHEIFISRAKVAVFKAWLNK